MKYFLPFIVIALLSSCGGKAITTGLKYSVTDSVYNTETSEYKVQIPKRYNQAQLDTISSILWSSNVFSALKIYFTLPGQTVGDGFTYAFAFYPSDEGVKNSEKSKDLNGQPYELHIDGVSASIAKRLYSFNPPNMATKTILGKFIHDADQTATVIYTDSRERPGYAFIADFDNTGKMIPIVATPIENENGTKKFIIDTAGHYYTLQDSILKRYEHGEDKPWTSIKSGY